MYTDILTKIHNAQKAKKPLVKFGFTNMDHAILEILARHGFIASVAKKGRMPKRILEVELKYEGDSGAISGMRFLSVPSRRIYSGYQGLRKVRQGYGLSIISTPKGILTGEEARKQKVGGQLLFEIW